MSILMHVIYEKPKDFPNKFVVREWHAMPGKIVAAADALTFDSLESAREVMPPNAVCIGRKENDDPCIAEVWL